MSDKKTPFQRFCAEHDPGERWDEIYAVSMYEEHQRTRYRDAMAGIAQGAINITGGLTTIEASSLIHKSMETLCELVSSSEVAFIGANLGRSKS